jgi:hypothetical protein
MIMNKTNPNSHFIPVMNILTGIIIKIVLRSSRIASTRVLRNTHVADNPAAASIEKSTPTEVVAENLASKKASFHEFISRTQIKYPAQKSQGKREAVAATK